MKYLKSIHFFFVGLIFISCADESRKDIEEEVSTTEVTDDENLLNSWEIHLNKESFPGLRK